MGVFFLLEMSFKVVGAPVGYFWVVRKSIPQELQVTAQINATSHQGLVAFWTVAGDLVANRNPTIVEIQMQLAILGTSFFWTDLARSKKFRQTQELRSLERKISDLTSELHHLEARKERLAEEAGLDKTLEAEMASEPGE